MNINNFRIKRDILQKTRLGLDFIRQNIISELQEDKYQITQETNDFITFDNSGPPAFEMRGASSSKLQEGIFEIVEKDENIVKLTYFVSYKYILLAFVALLAIACFYNAIVLALAAFLVITFGFDFLKQKSNAEELLARILNPGNIVENTD